ncbi:hypothetical protein LLE87_40125, partial [Paenibacillus polymyxa]|nr:hypothetical protein [Paenibacillus polymyxa]
LDIAPSGQSDGSLLPLLLELLLLTRRQSPPAELRAGITHTVRTMVAGAAPAPAVIDKMREIGFELTHVYGLTEVYG